MVERPFTPGKLSVSSPGLRVDWSPKPGDKVVVCAVNERSGRFVIKPTVVEWPTPPMRLGWRRGSVSVVLGGGRDGQ